MAAGFVDFEITWRADVFSGAPQQSSAAAYGTLGINFRARRRQANEFAATLRQAQDVALAKSAYAG